MRIVGMSRSGNHAIINWIIAQLQGRYCFLNCVEPKQNPYQSARPMANSQVYQTNIEDFCLPDEQQGRFTPKDWLIYSYEGCFLGMVNSPLFEQQHGAYVGISATRCDVLILRDPFNLFASRRRAAALDERFKRSVRATPKSESRIWKQHARAYLEPGRYLSNQRISINYNCWFTNQNYRRSIIHACIGSRFHGCRVHTSGDNSRWQFL
jgi:hypothetical protein